MPPRDRGRARARASDEEFVLFLQGIPAHCRWQELKDMVRQTALHIRQAVVYDDQHGFPTGLGQIIVKNEDEAWRTYHRLSTNGWDGQSLVVTLARTSSPTRPVAGPTKSPSCVIPPAYVAGYSTPPRVAQNLAIPPSPISPECVPFPCGQCNAANESSTPLVSMAPAPAPAYQGQGPEYAQVINPMAMPPPPPPYLQPFVPIFTDQLPTTPSATLSPSPCSPHTLSPATPSSPRPLLHHQQHQQQQQQQQQQHPSAKHHPLPAQTLKQRPNPNPDPTALHPRRTIFIQNLSPTTTPHDLTLFLQDAGTIEQCEMPLNPDTGRCKGFARVTFHSADEAKRAIALYNTAFFLGAKIRVKIDRSGYFSSGHGNGQGQGQGYAAREGYYLPNRHNQPERKTVEGDITPAPGTGPGPRTVYRNGGPQRETERDRCQPLVVNGSGLGSKTAVAI
ncbi:RNA-binding domain-containing protein [Aspergillus novofumigatus IBT 16806]|uniref:RNA-binding domain-containing protein n=1 Tax=Aspergillus novofumigatus (strain IBT 16806) TaxID=1392255 RepID=A0A2I1BWC6_ASPN1|nr:RNA-binding domain-containing protein [Aspergillus novofumigatus IBT 16806]PKX89687.1 RNA-binding domain-containing protein [Aspergillus novofumigatus IBT 16806]